MNFTVNRALSVDYRAPQELFLDPKNPRRHTPQQVEQIARSIQTFGFTNPVLVDRTGKVIAGHGRLAAAETLKLEAVPVIALEDLSPSQARAYLIADNRLAEHATWDRELLAENFALLSQEDLTFDLTVTGFELPEIDMLLNDEEAGVDPDDIPIKPGPAVSRLGDIWQCGPHRVVCGDALDPEALEVLMQGEKASVVFTDPPYNLKVSDISGLGKRQHREFAFASGEMSSTTFTDFLQRAMTQLAAHSVEGAIHYVCMDWRHMVELQAAAAPVYSELKSLVVWAKEAGGMGSLYRSQHELIFIYKVGKGAHRNNIQLGRFGRNRTNVWQYSAPRKFGSDNEGDLLAEHPTPKPVAMIADALMDVSNRGEIVLDTFLGSGSTLIAAERVGRIARGVELDPQYVDLTIRRWQRQTGRSAIHTQLQCTFNELAEYRSGENHE